MDNAVGEFKLCIDWAASWGIDPLLARIVILGAVNQGHMVMRTVDNGPHTWKEFAMSEGAEIEAC
jgi:hypothetical protein